MPVRGDARQEHELRGDDDKPGGRGGRESEPPAQEVAQRLPGGQSDDCSCRDAGHDEGDRAGARPVADQPGAGRGDHGPEAGDGDAEQDAAEEHDAEVRRDGRDGAWGAADGG